MQGMNAERLALGTILVAVLVLGLKLVAWWLTGSVALLSDALESLVNVGGAVMAWMAVHYAKRPADAGHPFGHYKAEYFSAVLEGIMIIIAALLIIQYRDKQERIQDEAPSVTPTSSEAAAYAQAPPPQNWTQGGSISHGGGQPGDYRWVAGLPSAPDETLQ